MMKAGLQPLLDAEKLKRDFPTLHQQVHGKKLVYLDNAATTQKPQQVIDAIRRYYEVDNANVHRGVHELSVRATDQFEEAREKVAKFIGAGDSTQVVWTRGTTEAINLIAASYGRKFIGKDDEIVISMMEHHSNIVPWQLLSQETGAKIKVIPINERGELKFDEYVKLLGPRTKLVCITHVSNALGTVNDVKAVVKEAHARNIPVLVDGAQAVPHVPVDVKDIGCDFYVLSGHKLFGPTGIGVMYGRKELLEKMPPYQGGGDMIKSVTFEKTVYNTLPFRFEAGTPHIAGAIGLGAAIDYLNGIGMERIQQHDHQLLEYATKVVEPIDGVRIIGTARNKASVLSFMVGDVHPHDVGSIMDQEGVAIRAGHHCAQPVMNHFQVPATARASFAFYNTREDCDALVQAIHKVKEVFG